MRVASRFRSILDKIRYTPLHPQWFAYRREHQRYLMVAELAAGRTLDIGCGRQQLRCHLPSDSDYVSVDGITTGERLYSARPDVFADAQHLPFLDRQFDTVIMLELLEHLEQPEVALRDALRLLRPGGKLIVSTPFLYPIHDAPWDFQRWTYYGLQRLANTTGATVTELITLGKPMESGCLMFNLALSWQTLTAPIIFRLPLLLLSVILIPISNLFAAALSPVAGKNNEPRFAGGYVMILKVGD